MMMNGGGKELINVIVHIEIYKYDHILSEMKEVKQTQINQNQQSITISE